MIIGSFKLTTHTTELEVSREKNVILVRDFDEVVSSDVRDRVSYDSFFELRHLVSAVVVACRTLLQATFKRMRVAPVIRSCGIRNSLGFHFSK